MVKTNVTDVTPATNVTNGVTNGVTSAYHLLDPRVSRFRFKIGGKNGTFSMSTSLNDKRRESHGGAARYKTYKTYTTSVFDKVNKRLQCEGH